jgi:hypothetical protein
MDGVESACNASLRVRRAASMLGTPEQTEEQRLHELRALVTSTLETWASPAVTGLKKGSLTLPCGTVITRR